MTRTSRQQRQLALEERPAAIALVDRRLVGRRRASHGGRDVGPVQLQPVVAVRARRLVGEAGAVHRPEQPVARAIAGEHAPGPVAAVGRRREADDEDLRGRVAEARHRAAPVVLVGVGRPLLGRHLLPPGHQPRAGPARHDLGGDGCERIHDPTVGWPFDHGTPNHPAPPGHARALRPPRPDVHDRAGPPRPGARPPPVRGRPGPGRGGGPADRRAAQGRRRSTPRRSSGPGRRPPRSPRPPG